MPPTIVLSLPGGIPANVGAVVSVPLDDLVRSRVAAPPCGMACTAVVAVWVPGTGAPGLVVPGLLVIGVLCERVGGAAESGIAEPPSEADGEPGFDGDTGAALSSDGAGVGSGMAVDGADGEAVTSTGVDSAPSAQFGLSSTAVVPRRNTTSVEPSFGTVPLVLPPSWSFAL